ncbi:MAG: metallophosphoesterase [Planctomycetota bacterium]
MMEQRQLTRRELLRMSAGALFAAGLWPGRLRAAGDGAAGEFWFCSFNDLHFVDADCAKYLAKVIAQMKASAPKLAFCLAAGDLSDHGKPQELAGLREVLSALDGRARVVMGNHDCENLNDHRAYEAIFPGQLNYRFEHQGWQVLGLDTTEGDKSSGTTVQPATFAWLDETLPKLDRKRPLIVFGHIPLGPDVKMRSKNADDVLARFKEHNLVAVFDGHFHGFTERKVGGITLTTNCCCAANKGNHDGTKAKGFFLCHAKDGSIERTFVEVKPDQKAASPQ